MLNPERTWLGISVDLLQLTKGMVRTFIEQQDAGLFH